MADASTSPSDSRGGRTDGRWRNAPRSWATAHCSPVLEGFLRNGDGRGSSPIIAMDEFDLSAVKSFLTLAKIVSHDAQGLLSMTEIVQMAPVIMPLIHKYDSHTDRLASQRPRRSRRFRPRRCRSCLCGQ